MFLCDPDRLTVTVRDGIVTIQGTPESTVVGRDIIEAAGHVEGVVAVRDRLSYLQDAPYRPPDTQLTVSGIQRGGSDNHRRPFDAVGNDGEATG